MRNARWLAATAMSFAIMAHAPLTSASHRSPCEYPSKVCVITLEAVEPGKCGLRADPDPAGVRRGNEGVIMRWVMLSKGYTLEAIIVRNPGPELGKPVPVSPTAIELENKNPRGSGPKLYKYDVKYKAGDNTCTYDPYFVNDM